MFAPQHKLDNIVLIVDNNKICMLDRCEKIIKMEPLEKRFSAFDWDCRRIDGHDIAQVCTALEACKTDRNGIPKVIIADTIKGKGVPSLESDTLCHIKSLNPQELRIALEGLS
jgi:transketolase